MRTHSTSFAVAAVAAISGLAFAGGCTSQTEGERTVQKAQRVEDAGQTIIRGEKMIQDGKAQITRGQTLQQQGDNPGGQREIDAGRTLQKQGEALVQQGRRMK